MKRLVALALLLAVSASPAIEPPKGQPPPEPAAKAEPAKTDGGPAAPVDDAAKPAETVSKDADEEELPPLPPDAATAGPPPQRFNPTEKVRADFPVSFPIDI